MWTQSSGLKLALRRAAPIVVAGSLSIVPNAAGAANREHQQIVADIRMLQEQTQQLQVTLGALTDALKTLTSRLDEQGNVTRKAFADQKLIIDGLTGEVRIVREKVDDSNVRLSTLSQEVESLRQPTVPQPTMTIPPPDGSAGTTPGGAPSAGTPAGTPDAGVPPGGGATAPPAPTAAPIGMSPTRLYELAQADYAGGQWALAINGFETYLRTYPKTDRADDAQFFIGEAYQLDGKFKEAVAAYDKVITDFPTADRVPDAFYKRGLAYSRLAQNDKARESFETVIQKFPNAEASRLAKQVLDRLSRGGRDQDDQD